MAASSVKKSVLKKLFTFRKWRGKGWRSRRRRRSWRKLRRKNPIRLPKTPTRAETGRQFLITSECSGFLPKEKINVFVHLDLVDAMVTVLNLVLFFHELLLQNLVPWLGNIMEMYCMVCLTQFLPVYLLASFHIVCLRVCK